MKNARFLALGFLLTVFSLSCFAADRWLAISVPMQAAAHSSLSVSITAQTDAGAGEHIGFLHAEYSVDGGANWIGICYDEKLGSNTTRTVAIKVGPASSKTLVRARAAFRGGAAGDVDFTGAPIKWDQSWTTWGAPPAKITTIAVK